MRKFLLLAILILTLAGAVDAGYLLTETIRGGAIVCPNIPAGKFNLSQCNVVLATPYAKIFWLPTAFYGLTAYLLLFILVLYEMTGKWAGAKRLLLFFSGLGFLASVYFVYLQFFIIEALCFYCLISASMMTLIFILSAAYNIKYSKNSSHT